MNRNNGLKEIDEAGKKTAERIKLLILCEQKSGRVVIKHVSSETEAEVRPVFQRHVLPGSVAHTDGAATYAMIVQWGQYDVRQVNHSKAEFSRIEPDGTTTSSNKVESVISHIKSAIRIHWGFPYQRFWLFLEKLIWNMYA